MSHDYSNLEQQHNRGPGAHLSSSLAPPWKMSSKQNSYFHRFKRGLSHTHQARCSSFKFVEQLFLQYKFQKIKVCTEIQDRMFHYLVWTHNFLTLSWMVSILEVYIVNHKIVIKFNEQIRDDNETMAILRSLCKDQAFLYRFVTLNWDQVQSMIILLSYLENRSNFD